MITVLFSSHNGARTLPKMLDALCQINHPDGGWKIIAVNNASTDATSDILDSYTNRLPLQVLHHAEKGKNSALNAALTHIQGELVVLTDDDVLPAQDWLITLQDAAEKQPDFDIFGGTIEPEWPTPPPEWILNTPYLNFSYALTDPSFSQGEISSKLIWGPNMMVRAKVFNEGHRFRTSIGPKGGTAYIMGSETEFTNRLSALGHRCWFEPSAKVRHIIRPEQLQRKWLLGRAYRYGKTTALQSIEKGSLNDQATIQGVPRWMYKAIPLTALRGFFRGAVIQHPASFQDMWKLYGLLGSFTQYRLHSKDNPS